jgi:hypothetical protein
MTLTRFFYFLIIHIFFDLYEGKKWDKFEVLENLSFSGCFNKQDKSFRFHKKE